MIDRKVIESAIFWRREFSNLRTGLTNNDANDANETMVNSARAAEYLLKQAFPSLDSSKIVIFIEKKAIPDRVSVRAFFQQDIERIGAKFAGLKVEPSANDILAIIFETTGKIPLENADLDGLDQRLQRELHTYRTLYPSARLALEMIENDDSINKKTQHCLEVIDQATQDQIKAVRTQISGDVEAAKASALKDIENNGKTHIENAKNELKENFILQDAMTLWDTKAKQHMKFFYSGAGIFSVTIILAVIVLICYWTPITGAVKNLAPNGQSIALGNLVLVTVPVLACAWVLRLLSRFTLQNLNLADDAAQRSVMAKTYLRLVGEGKADEDKDRAIMLNALFRPVPGAKEQDLQPPNLSDFISK